MKEYKYKINGNIYKVSVGDIDNNVAHVQVNGTPYTVELENTTKPVTVVNSPRPAAAPDTVVILEAIKMENAIHAGRDGKIASIAINTGDSVLEGNVLITLE